MTDTRLFEHFRSELARGVSAVYAPRTEVARDDAYVLYYTPFEHEDSSAELVVVGMTPGPTQLSLSYVEAGKLLSEGVSDIDALVGIKPIGAFGGDKVRPNLVKQLDHFSIGQRLGLQGADEMWGIGFGRFHATSVVPHAAFHIESKTAKAGLKLFAGSFKEVVANKVLRDCFEQHFLGQLRRLNRKARYIGLGPTPKGALLHAVSRGIIDADQILGTFAHPSTSGGSRVKLYLREARVGDLHPKDPARRSAAEYHADYDEMTRNVERWRPIADTGGISHWSGTPRTLHPAT